MSNCVTAITLNEYNQRFSDWKEVVSLNTEEDVATFIDTFEESKLAGYSIIKVITKDEKYIFVYVEENTGYDFIPRLNELTPDGVFISVQNVKLLFDKSKSRGYYIEKHRGETSITPLKGNPHRPTVKPEIVEDDDSKTDILDEDDDDSATGFMDESDYIEHGVATKQYFLIQKDTGARIKIDDSRGVTIGRSSAKVDFVVGSQKVSRKHARVYLQDEDCMVADCDSVNGTFINGLRVRAGEDMVLAVGSVLLLGDVEFTLTE